MSRVLLLLCGEGEKGKDQVTVIVMVGMAHCYLQLDDANSALECFRLALRINPDLEGVRSHISHLEKILDEN